LSALSADPAPYPELELLTEHSPPLSWYDEKTGTFSGINVQISMELMRRAGVPYHMKILPRNRAYREAVEKPNTCIIGLIHTEERADLYSWIKPIATGGWGLYKKPGSPITLNSLDDAMGYSIATATNYPSTEMLEKAGHPKLVKVTFSHALKLLDLGRVDLALSGLRAVGPTARVEDVPVPELALVLRRVEAGIACNLGLDAKTLHHLNETTSGMTDFIDHVLEEAAKIERENNDESP